MGKDELISALCSCNACGKKLNTKNERFICNDCINKDKNLPQDFAEAVIRYEKVRKMTDKEINERYIDELFKDNEKLKVEVLRLRTTLAEIQDWERLCRGASIKQEYEIENGKGSWPI